MRPDTGRRGATAVGAPGVARGAAAVEFANWPPSEKLSGVTLTIPMTLACSKSLSILRPDQRSAGGQLDEVMCLAIPGKVIEVFQDRGLRMARVDFGGTVKKACLEQLPEAVVTLSERVRELEKAARAADVPDYTWFWWKVRLPPPRRTCRTARPWRAA